jgi:5-methylcytosine-specific restriction endonuclease McrA
MAKSKKSKLTSEADNLWYRKYLKEFCEVCGKPASQLHHFFPKGLYPSLRYHPENGISLCVGCHFSHHMKGDPLIHQRIIETRGDGWYLLLKRESQNKIKPRGIMDLEAIIEELKT